METAFPPVGKTGRCPHCGVTVMFHAPSSVAMPTTSFSVPYAGAQLDNPIALASAQCPSCGRTAVMLNIREPPTKRWVWPEGVTRPPIPASVPDAIAQDYREAALVLQYSPAASAALSRRCLQNLLHDNGFDQKELVEQIKKASAALPGYLARDLDYLREIGNFAAHPRKSENTGEILGVEPGEADWSLEVLEMLFDHLYSKPVEADMRRLALNEKLRAVGKKTLK